MAFYCYFLYRDLYLIDAVHVDARDGFSGKRDRCVSIGGVFPVRYCFGSTVSVAVGDIAEFAYLLWEPCGASGIDGYESSRNLSIPHNETVGDCSDIP